MVTCCVLGLILDFGAKLLVTGRCCGGKKVEVLLKFITMSCWSKFLRGLVPGLVVPTREKRLVVCVNDMLFCDSEMIAGSPRFWWSWAVFFPEGGWKVGLG